MSKGAHEGENSSPAPAPDSPYVEHIGPTEVYDPVIKTELKRAIIWALTVTVFVLIAFLAQPILLIFGGIVIAAMLDGGSRLLGRVLPIPRPFRLAIVVLLVVGFLGWTAMLAGNELASQAARLQMVLESQVNRIGDWAASVGLSASAEDLKTFGKEIISSVGQVTAAVTTVVGGVASVVMMLVLAVFIAAEPRLYERGIAWMVPLGEREFFYGTMERMGMTLRRLMAGRLLGMVIEGLGTWILLQVGGVPMAALLGVLTGLLAFLPNIGSIISGALIILVGFSTGSVETGLYAFFVYILVQMVDGYLIVPMVAKRAVDLAPALVLGAQILFGTMFGILGLALADPAVAMLKVWLERRSVRTEQRGAERAAQAAARARSRERRKPKDAEAGMSA